MNYRDEQPLETSFTIPLQYKNSWNKSFLWLEEKKVNQEYFFDDLYNFDIPEKRFFVLKEQIDGKLREMLGSMDNPLLQNPSLVEFMFQPVVCFSDSFQERNLAYHAAQNSEGNVLAIGLRMAIFPQFCSFLKRNISKITIIESDKNLINLIEDTWDKPDFVEIIHDKALDFLQKSSQKFDTIYLHEWQGLHHNFLPYINRLISVSKNILSQNGKILAAGYNFMKEDFMGLCWQMEYEKDRFELDKNKDVLLMKYLDWRKTQNHLYQKTVFEKAAQLIAETFSETMPEINTQTFLGRYF